MKARKKEKTRVHMAIRPCLYLLILIAISRTNVSRSADHKFNMNKHIWRKTLLVSTSSYDRLQAIKRQSHLASPHQGAPSMAL